MAAFNRSGNKIGQDLGRVAGLGRDLGIVVQDCDTASYDKLDADIGVVAQTNFLSENLPTYRRLMNAGLNVACHGTESYYPVGCDPVIASEIDALAKKNRVTFTGSGIWDMSRIWSGILVTAPCTEIKSIFHRSITDMKGQATKEQSRQWGIGLTVAEWKAKGFEHNRLYQSYKTIPEHVLAAIGYTVTNTRVYVEPVVFDVPFESDLMECVIPAGYAVGMRSVGEIDTAEGVTGRIETEGRLFKSGEIEHMFWSVNGKPATRIRVERDDSAHATASNIFNRLPQIVAAPPGIVLVSQLGPMQHTARIHA